MSGKEWEVAGGSLGYEVRDGKAVVTGFQGEACEVEVPRRMGDFMVAALDKKAFLSRKRLRRVSLPDTLEEVGDWAFAYCGGLREVRLPEKALRFGKDVFLECGALQRVTIYGGKPGVRNAAGLYGNAEEPRDAAEPYGDAEKPPGVAELLAAAVTALDSYYLLDVREAGSREWFARWDAKLVSVLRTPDTEGYSRQVLCGEEDYGSTDLAAYTGGRRKEKARLALLRLLYPEGSSPALRKELEEYLLTHTAGCGTDEAWRVILEEHGGDRAYYGLFAELGCVNGENLERILADVGEDFPEMKAYFLGGSLGSAGGKDYFADLEL